MARKLLTASGVLCLAAVAWVLATDPWLDGFTAEDPDASGSTPPPEPAPAGPEPEVIEVDPGEEDLGTAWQRAFFEAMAAAAADAGTPAPVPLAPVAAAPAGPSVTAPPPAVGAPPAVAAPPVPAPRPPSPRPPSIAAREAPPPLPEPPEPPSGAALDKDSVKAAVNAIKPGVRECYKQGLRQDPYLAGEVYIRFTVTREGDEGRIQDAEFLEDQSTMADVIVQACILEALSRARFPPPSGEKQRVTYPFQFRKVPRKQPAAPP